MSAFGTKRILIRRSALVAPTRTIRRALAFSPASRACVLFAFCADHDEDCRYDLLCWGCGREGTAPTARLDEHVDRIRSPLRSGQGHHTPERLDEHVDRIR